VKLGKDPEVEAFRAELSRWLDENLPPAEEATEVSTSSADMPGWTRRWQRVMYDAGWLLPMQPPEYGGRNATLPQLLAYQEELSRRRVYHSFNPQGVGIIAASILSFGTEEQKKKWAIPILRGDLTAALGMSEPGAGSDLAGLKTRATLDGGHFVVNGQKVWTSGAHHADLILTFVRTDPDAPKHKGISVLIVPTDLPGVTRRPFPNMTEPDDIDFNEVFFDNARVPAENLLGELHKGWAVANGSLGHERTMLWVSYADRLDDLIRDSPSDSDWFATVLMDVQALRLMGYQQLSATLNGTASPAATSVLKLFGSEAIQQGALNAMEEHGEQALLHPALTGPHTHLSLDAFIASWFERYARTFPSTIAGGTSEIHRNVIAERILGLPR
jgi:alkylation response protein AidB-like acyl-CoA dehydrogenase